MSFKNIKTLFNLFIEHKVIKSSIQSHFKVIYDHLKNVLLTFLWPFNDR